MREALGRPETYAHRPSQVEVRETHISWVFLAGERVYKLKKPLVLDFVDYGTPDRRRAMCDAEVRLNRRLAPDIYLGVRGVAIADGGARLTSAEDPRAVDFVVEMRRYDDRHTLAGRLRRGELEHEQVMTAGLALAQFHAGVPVAHETESPTLAVERRYLRNSHELLAVVHERSDIGRVQALERFAHALVAARAATFQSRADRGCLREGHGDLRAEHVLVDGAVQVVDCVEFDLALRTLDVADDLAFLVSDLAAQGGERFVETLVRSYRDAGGDPGENWLIAFYASYRSLVRAKVALVRAAQLHPASGQAAEASAHARDLLMLAERFAWRARQPLVIVVCGLPASGKSVLAAALADLSELPHLSSDVVRKRLAGLVTTQRAPSGSYTAAWNTRTYAELGRCAAQALSHARGVIVDATFRHRADREAFASALGDGVSPTFVECRVPHAVLVDRARRRERDAGRVSDADASVVRRELDSWEPLDELAAGAHLTLRTDRPVAQIVGDVLAHLDRGLLDA